MCAAPGRSQAQLAHISQLRSEVQATIEKAILGAEQGALCIHPLDAVLQELAIRRDKKCARIIHGLIPFRKGSNRAPELDLVFPLGSKAIELRRGYAGEKIEIAIPIQVAEEFE